MPPYNYDRLSAQDASFLVFETDNVPMHIAATQIYESGPLRTEDGGVDFTSIKKSIATVLHLIPRYRQKLQWIPLAGLPVWIDDRDFNLDYHVRHTALPRPGGMEQLKRLSARIMSHQLDRARPLWEMWIVEGLEGDRFAMIAKMHHCMLDGEAGADLAQILMSPDPQRSLDHDSPAYIPRPAPSGMDLLRDETLRRLSLPLKAIRSFQALAQESEGVRQELGIRARAIGELLGWAVRAPSETPMNGELGPHRRFDWLTIPLDEVKAVRRALGCTVNDVVLATVTGAVRDFLIRRRVQPENIDFRVSAPVSVRRDEQKGQMGNQVSSWIIRLPVDEREPLARMQALHLMTQELKESRQALGVEMMMAMAEFSPGMLLSLGARAASGPINMIVTNVPGPQFPLYFLGAKLLHSFPMVPLLANTGLGIALFSYNGTLNWGFNADYALLPDLAAFRDGVARSFRELTRAAGLGDDAAPTNVRELQTGPRGS